MTTVNPDLQKKVYTAQTQLATDAKNGANSATLSTDIAALIEAQSDATPGTKMSDEFQRIDNFMKQEGVSGNGQTAVHQILQNDLKNSGVTDNNLDELAKVLLAETTLEELAKVLLAETPPASPQVPGSTTPSGPPSAATPQAPTMAPTEVPS